MKISKKTRVTSRATQSMRFSWTYEGEEWRIMRNGKVLSQVPTVVRKEKMWRVRFLNGRYSDVTNLSRAKDAALVFADRIIFPRPSPKERAMQWAIKLAA